jgi:hypothetical protein
LKLANLNSRKAGKTWSGNDTSSGAITQLRGERENQELSGGGDEYGGIRECLVGTPLKLTLTECVLQMSTGPLWYSDFQVLNRSLAGLTSSGSY